MKTHLNLARKYRPQNFQEILEQDVLVKTLTFAIKSEKLASCYLLTGIRGIGKTTTARIIAKTVNCEDLTHNNNIPIPCGKCQNCLAFNNGSHPDILEIDAASRTGVDDVRGIIESAEYKPLQGKYKIFIIDEVHMLSKNAFNALLKLIEEPPLHTIFIMATTEVHKIPLTVISRCQRFDLSRFSIEGIFNLLKKVSDDEKIEYEDDALSLISAKSDGSARDSLSLLDQAAILAKSKGNKVSTDIVKKMVSAVDKITIINYFSSILDSDIDAALNLIEEFHNNNSDFVIFIKELMELTAHLSKTLISKNYTNINYKPYSNEIDKLISETDIEFTQIAWQLAFKTSSKLKDTFNQKEALDMLTVNLIHILGSNSSSHQEEKITSNISANNAKEEYSLKKKFDNFEKFLVELKEKKEFELYYEIFNNTDYRKDGANLLIKLKKHDRKFENQIYEALTNIYGQIHIDFEYDENMTSKKESLKEKFNNKEIVRNISKDFSGFEIIDILLSEEKR